MKDEIKVTIQCLVYNHEAYLMQCLDGFVMQKTNFKFEAIVHDDASTDKSADIIREYAEKYPDIIKPILEKENLYSKHDGSIFKIMREHTRGKYVAYCEGDDYWIDSNKLQKQVEFLESHPDYGMCYTNFNILDEKSKRMRHSIFFSESNSYPIYDDLETWIKNTGFVAPQTWVVRTNLWVSKPNMTAVDGTYLFFAYFLYKSKVCCLKDETTAVYRIVSESASHTKSLHKYYNYLCGIREEQLFLAREYIHDYNKSNEIIKCINDNFYKKQVRRVLLLGSKRDVMSTRKQFFDQKGSNKILLIVTFIIPLSIFRNVYLFYLKKRYNHED